MTSGIPTNNLKTPLLSDYDGMETGTDKKVKSNPDIKSSGVKSSSQVLSHTQVDLSQKPSELDVSTVKNDPVSLGAEAKLMKSLKSIETSDAPTGRVLAKALDLCGDSTGLLSIEPASMKESASELAKAMLDTNNPDLELLLEDLDKKLSGKGVNQETKALLASVTMLKGVLQSALEEVSDLPDSSQEVTEMKKTATGMLQGQIDALDERAEYLDQQTTEQPITKGNVLHYQELAFQAGVDALDKQLENPKLTEKQRGALENTRDELQGRIDQLKQQRSKATDLDTPMSQNDIKGMMTERSSHKTFLQSLFGLKASSLNLSERVTEMVGDAMKSAGLNKKDAKHAVLHATVELLNDQKWESVSNTVRFQHKGAELSVLSQIVPGAKMEEVFPNKYDGKGVCCHSAMEAKHAVNLATSDLKSPDGKTLFQGVRHGVNSAYELSTKTVKAMSDQEIKDLAKATGQGDVNPAKLRSSSKMLTKFVAEAKKQANINRAKEVILASLAQNPALLKDALDGKTPTVRLTSLSLMTPDIFRSGSSGEKKMLSEQQAAWKALMKQQPLSLEVRDPESGTVQQVNIKPEILSFSTGVNAGAVNWYSGIAGGWGTSDPINREGLKSLLGPMQNGAEFGGWVKDYLDTNGGSTDPKVQKDVKIVKELAAQIREIMNSNAHHSSGGDPYKLGARITLLSHKLGATPAWNCKSGKDRTGELDVEVKFLAMRSELEGTVPPFNQKLNTQQKAMFREFALNSGNLEIQKMNTGAGGFKLEGVGAITERLGGTEPKLIHRGLSKFVKS